MSYEIQAVACSGGSTTNELDLDQFPMTRVLNLLAGMKPALKINADRRWHLRRPKAAGFCYLRMFPRCFRRELAEKVGAFPTMDEIRVASPFWHPMAVVARWSVSRWWKDAPLTYHVESAAPIQGPARRRASVLAREPTFPRTYCPLAGVGSSSSRPEAVPSQGRTTLQYTGFPDEAAAVFRGLLNGSWLSLKELERVSAPEVKLHVDALARRLTEFRTSRSEDIAWVLVFPHVRAQVEALLLTMTKAPTIGVQSGLAKKVEAVHVALGRIADARQADRVNEFMAGWESNVPFVPRESALMTHELAVAGSTFDTGSEYTEHTGILLGPDDDYNLEHSEWVLPDTVVTIRDFVELYTEGHRYSLLWEGNRWKGDPLFRARDFILGELQRRALRFACLAISDGDPTAGELIRVALVVEEGEAPADTSKAGFVAWVLACMVFPSQAFGHIDPFGERIPDPVLSIITAAGLVSPAATKEQWVEHVREELNAFAAPRDVRTVVATLATPELFIGLPRTTPNPLVDTIAIEGLAVLITSGVNPDTAAAAMLRTAIELQGAFEVEAGGVNPGGVASALMQGAEEARTRGDSPVDSLIGLMEFIRDWCFDHSVTTKVFDFFLTIVSRAWEQLKSFALHVVGALVAAVEAAKITDRTVLVSAGVLLDAVASFVDPHYRRNPKPVWALLFRSAQSHLTPSEALLLHLPEFHLADTDSYEGWAKQIITALGATAPTDLPMLHADPPTRSVHFPRGTYGHANLEPYMTNLEGRLVETERERGRLAKLIESGAVQGIDGAWMATPEAVTESLERYTSAVPALDSQARALIMESVDALVDQFPEMYLHSKPMSVGAVMAAMQWKYSAGLPFLPVVQSRRTLQTSPWFARIRRGAERLLSNPALPGNAFHCFPKTDVVPLTKALQLGGLRTVTASSVLMSIVINTVGLETAKRVPPPRALVANMLPRTEHGHKNLWEAVASRGETYLADAWRFDSTVPAEVVDEATPALRALGYRGRWGAKAAESLFRCYYEGISRGWLVNLMDGSILRKRHGGGTGSTYTAVDNRDWLRMLLPAAWAQLTGKRVAEFYDNVTLANASDDLTIGVAPDSLDTRALTKILYENYGVVIEFQRVARDDALPDGFLHLLVVPKDEVDSVMYSEIGVDRPEFSLRTDPARLAMKRTAYRSDRASLSNDRTSDYLVGRGLGHLQLCAHHPGLYDDLVQEVMEDTTDRLNMWFKDVFWTVDRDKNGLIVDARLTSYGGLQPNMVHRIRRRGINPVVAEDRLRKFTDNWLRAHRVPSYKDVFRAWVTKPLTSRRGAETRYKKVNYLADSSFPITDFGRIKVIQARELLLKFGGALSKARPELGAPIAPAAHTWSLYYIESFIWAHLYRNAGGTRPSDAEFYAAVRRSPYAAATDPVVFLWKTNDAGFYNHLVRLAGPAADQITCAMFWYTLIYSGLDMVLGRLMRSPVVGVFLHFWLFTTELSIVYSIANNLHWLGSGQSSPEISSLMPKDQYAFQKQFAAMILGFVPIHFLHVKGAYRAAAWLPAATSAVTKFIHAGSVGRTTLQKALLPPDTPWRAAAEQFTVNRGRPAAEGGSVQAIVAATGSGKSTILPAILVRSNQWIKILLLCPTRVSRDEYDNPFLPSTEYQSVDADRPIDWGRRGLAVMTYGFYLQAIHRQVAGMEGVLVLLDEAHLAHTEIIAVLVSVPAHRRLLISATPDRRVFGAIPQASIIRVAGAAQFDVPVSVSNAIDDDLLLEARRAHPLEFLRALVIHPSERICDGLVAGLESSGVRSSVLSRSRPIVPVTGVIVATSVVDTAVTLVPAPTMVVDFGYVLEVSPLHYQTAERRVQARLVASGPSVARQRLGRVGRIGSACAVVSARAGTGIEQPPIVNPYWYVRDVIRADSIGRISGVHIAFDLPQLADSLRWIGWDAIRAECHRDSDLAGWYIVCFLLMMGTPTIMEAIEEIQGWYHNPSAHENLDHTVEWVRSCGWMLATPPDYTVLRAWSARPPTFVYIRGQLTYTFTVSTRYRVMPSGRYIGLIGPPSLPIDGLPVPPHA